MHQFYIYILYSPAADKYYVGHTKDYNKRLLDHNTQEYFETYTSKYRPWKLKAVFLCAETEREAISLERFIKKQKSRMLLEKLIDPNFEPGGRLARLVRVPHLRDHSDRVK